MGSQRKSAQRGRPSSTIAALVEQRLQAHVAELVDRDSALGGAPSEEDVHQARVAARRLRSDLRLFAPFFHPKPVAGLRPELGWLAAKLGAVRDLDVLGDLLDATATTLDIRSTAGPVLDRVAADRAVALADLHIAMRGDRYGALLAALNEFAADPPLRSGRGTTARTAMPKLVRRSWKALRTAARAIEPSASAQELHRVRILSKRTRYAVEAVDGLGFKKARTLARRLTDLQDHLGRLNDRVTAVDWLTRVAPSLDVPADVTVVSVLTEALGDEADLLAESWEAVWSRADRRSLRRWFS